MQRKRRQLRRADRQRHWPAGLPSWHGVLCWQMPGGRFPHSAFRDVAPEQHRVVLRRLGRQSGCLGSQLEIWVRKRGEDRDRETDCNRPYPSPPSIDSLFQPPSTHPCRVQTGLAWKVGQGPLGFDQYASSHFWGVFATPINAFPGDGVSFTAYFMKNFSLSAADLASSWSLGEEEKGMGMGMGVGSGMGVNGCVF